MALCDRTSFLWQSPSLAGLDEARGYTGEAQVAGGSWRPPTQVKEVRLRVGRPRATIPRARGAQAPLPAASPGQPWPARPRDPELGRHSLQTPAQRPRVAKQHLPQG